MQECLLCERKQKTETNSQIRDIDVAVLGSEFIIDVDQLYRKLHQPCNRHKPNLPFSAIRLVSYIAS
jgi:hypothetical protein